MKKIGYVYLTTNLVNGKQYVGQHLHDGFDSNYKGSGTYIKRAFEKYGWDNFDCKVICWCSTQIQLNEAEDNYIKLFDTMVPNGYNLKGGGGAKGRYSKETRKKISEALKGKKASEKTCKKLSEVFKGHKVSEETRKKISQANKGKRHTKESKQKISEGHKNHPKLSRKVLQFTKNGEFVKEWCSIMEIQRVLGYAQQNISACCNGKPHHKSAYGFIWRYA